VFVLHFCQNASLDFRTGREIFIVSDFVRVKVYEWEWKWEGERQIWGKRSAGLQTP